MDLFELDVEVDERQPSAEQSEGSSLKGNAPRFAEPESQRQDEGEGSVHSRPIATERSASDKSDRFLGTSLPISIGTPKQRREPESPEPEVFVPPHQLAQAASCALLDGSLPEYGSSRIRARNKVLRQTGFLPANTSEGFLVSRSGVANTVASKASVPGSVASGSFCGSEALRGRPADASDLIISLMSQEALQQTPSMQDPPAVAAERRASCTTIFSIPEAQQS